MSVGERTCARKPPQARDGSYIRRGKHTSNFTILPNSLLQNPKLTHRQVGIMVSVLSRPADWVCCVWQLSEGAKEGRDAVRTALKALRRQGYVSLVYERQPNGTIHTVYYVFADPADNNMRDISLRMTPATENPSPDDPTPAEPATANQRTNKDLAYKAENKKEETSATDGPLQQSLASPASDADAAAVALLRQIGMDERAAVDLAGKFSLERIEESIATMRWRRAAGKCESPAGYVREMLTKGWDVPKAIIDAKRKKLIAEKNAEALWEEKLREQAERERLSAAEQHVERVVSGMEPQVRESYVKRAIRTYEEQDNTVILRMIEKHREDPAKLIVVRHEMVRLWDIDNGRSLRPT